MEAFVENNINWAHIDIAGPALDENNVATGYGIKFLANYYEKNQA